MRYNVSMAIPWFIVLTLLDGTVASLLASANARIDVGTFEKPSALVRPRFRYWLPDASVDPSIVKADIKSAVSIGAGGVEFLPFYNYGAGLGPEPPGADWKTFNFGTPAFRAVFQAALEAHAEAGSKMDFAMGPNQGQGVPAEPNDEGLQWDLITFSEKVCTNSSFVIPGWATGDLIAFVAAEIVSERNVSMLVEGITGNMTVEYVDMVLKSNSLEERTSHVKSDGTVTLSLPSTCNPCQRVFAFYQKLTHHKNLRIPNSNSSSIFSDGSYAVDHFSGQGAQVVTNFWEKHILSREITQLLVEVGHYGWEDSIELSSNVSWSTSIPERFKKMHGYRINKFLPLLVFGQNDLLTRATQPGSIRAVLDTEDAGMNYISDFHATLTAGYREYLQTMKNWINTRLGLELSIQVGYGIPVDTLAAVPEVDVPECERPLNFIDIDSLRRFTGAAQLAGKRVISNEMGAKWGGGFAFPIPELLGLCAETLISGVNQFIIHGQTYTGNYFNTTWPGVVPFNYLFADANSNKQPSWDHGLAEALEFLARNQQVLQSGVPKSDVAVLWTQSETSWTELNTFQDLVKDGWSYTYVSPENFKLPQAYVENGFLAPEGPSWKVLLVESTQNLTVSSVQTLADFASKGLPIVVRGGDPGCFPTGNISERAEVQQQLAELLEAHNVYTTSHEQFSDLLCRIGITPRAQLKTDVTSYYTWRETENITFVYIWASKEPAVGEVIVSDDRVPYYFNAWTGERTAIIHYTVSKGLMSIPISLAANQSIILAFSNELSEEIATPSFHVVEAPANVLGYSYSKELGLGVQLSGKSSSSVTLSDDRRISLKGGAPSSFALTNWTLIAEHWEAPRSLSNASIIAAKRNTTHDLDQLTDWRDIPALANVSGVGYYTTSFMWCPRDDLGAYIFFSKIVHTARLYINGRYTAPLDVFNARVDITSFLSEGYNEVKVVVPTTMINYLRTIMSDLWTAGGTPAPLNLGSVQGPLESGLVGQVSVQPYSVQWISM